MRPTDTTYRPDIDGLRAVAVLGVIAFHAFGKSLPGGFVGVDVFFVISGYLISAIISRRIAEGRFSFANFYGDRIRRLAPALLCMLAVVLGAGWLLLIHQAYAKLAGDALASLAFVANFRFLSQSGYFDTVSQNNPLLHLWSLGVEEQFYIVWPALLVLALRLRRAGLAAGVLALVSFALSAWMVRLEPATAFYSPLTRAWELMVGALLALNAPRLANLPGVARQAFSVLGLALILAAMVLLNAASPMPGPRALAPTLGAALLIAAGPGALGNRLLALPGVPFIGRISFPLYLWHWPLLVYLHIANFGFQSPTGERLLALGAAFALAAATYVWVEQPVQKRRLVPVKALLTTGAALAVLSVALLANAGVPGRAADTDPRRQFLRSYENLGRHELGAAYRFGCDFYYSERHDRGPVIDQACTEPGRRATVLLWGDSHAQALSLGLRGIASPDVAVAQVATSGCAPSFPRQERLAPGDACDRSNAYAVAAIRRLHPSTVVMAQRAGHEAVDWETVAKRLHALGVSHVVVVGPLPQWRFPLPSIVAARHWPGGADYIGDDLASDVLRVDQRLLQRYGRSNALTYVSLIGRLCNASGCRARVPGTGGLTAFDYGHLTPEGSAFVAQTVLRPALRRQGSGATDFP